MSNEPRLLVVDDEAVVCQACRRIFTPQGFQVEESTDAREGLSRATENDYAAILLDIKMPVMDGVQFLETLRGEKPDLPVIFVTGYPSISSAASAVRLGASDYVRKPFTPEEITQAVQRSLARRDTQTTKKAISAPPEVEPWSPRAGEFRFFDESWFQLGKDGAVRGGAMHQRMPEVPMPFEGSMRVGALLDPSEAATVEAVRLPRVGKAVYQGLPLAGLIIAGKPPRIVPSPISGVVVAVNPLLEEDLSALWEDPCGKGWIACISPTRFEQDVKNCQPRRALLANADEASARRQCERLVALGCQVHVAKDWEELHPALQDPNHNLLVFDAVSFGEQGPDLVGRASASAPEMKIVLLASPDSQREAAYRRHRILCYAVEPFADQKIVEILDIAFRPKRQPLPHVEPTKPASGFLRSISIINRKGNKVCLLASGGLLQTNHGLGWLLRHKLLDQCYPVETLLGSGDVNRAGIWEMADTCDRLLVLLARDTGHLAGNLVQDTEGKFVPVTGQNSGKVMALVVQPHSAGKGLAGLDDRTTAALAEHIVHEMASC